MSQLSLPIERGNLDDWRPPADRPELATGCDANPAIHPTTTCSAGRTRWAGSAGSERAGASVIKQEQLDTVNPPRPKPEGRVLSASFQP